MCGTDRNTKYGYCQSGDILKISRVGLHMWEEPCISVGAGSGTVFFSGCNMRCVFCQNYEISRGDNGKEISVDKLAEEFLLLRDMGAANINLVTPTHYADKIIKALDLVKAELGIPICYNCGGYESVDTLKMLEGYIDVYMPDFKYCSTSFSSRYSGAADYFEVACAALSEMYRQTGYAVYDKDGKMTRGVLTRHLVLPGLYKDSIKILEYLAGTYEPERFALSLMSQYFPTQLCADFPEINRKVTSLEYKKVTDKALELGFVNAYIQEKSSSNPGYVPDFDY